MPRIFLMLIVTVATMLGGCGKSDIAKPVPKTESVDRLFDSQRQDLERAKQVQQQVNQQAESQRQNIEQQTHE